MRLPTVLISADDNNEFSNLADRIAEQIEQFCRETDTSNRYFRDMTVELAVDILDQVARKMTAPMN